MSQTASSKFRAACGMENGFAAACDMYLETMVYLSTSSNFDCLLGSLRKEFVISFPPNDEMLPVWVPEAQPEPDAGDLSLCLLSNAVRKFLPPGALCKASVLRSRKQVWDSLLD